MPRDLTPAQVALLLAIDDASSPRMPLGRGLIVPSSPDRTRIAREGYLRCKRWPHSRTVRWTTTESGKLRAERERTAERETREDQA